MARPWITTLVAFLLGSNVAAAQEGWLELRSDNYTFIGDVEDEDLIDVATRFEAFRSAVAELFSPRQYPEVDPMTVVVVDNDDFLEELGLTGSNAYFLPDEGENYIAMLTESSQRRPFDRVLHDYFHAIADESIPNAPLWLVEGLAEFYRTATWSTEGTELQIGRPIDSFVRLVREEGARLAFDQLFALSRDSDSYDEAEREDIFHAQTWAFVHFLMTRNEGQGYAAMIRFVRLMASEISFEEAVDDALGLSFRSLLSEFENSVRQRGTYPYLTLAVANASRGVGSAEPEGISPVEVETQLAELLIRLGATDEAEERLQRAIELDPGSRSPRIVMGRLLIDQARFEEARLSLESVVAGSDADFLSQYYYGLSLVSGNSEPSPAQLDEARSAWRDAIRIGPRFADSYQELALSYLSTNENMDEAAELLDTALELRPRQSDYRISLARVFIEQERFADARTLLIPLVDPIQHLDTQRRAQAVLQSIDGLEGNRGVVGDGFVEITQTDSEPDEVDLSLPDPEELASPSLGFDRIELTRIVSGEQQNGLLSLIDCREGLTLTVEADSGTYLFHTDSPERIEFESFSAGVGTEVSCGPLDPPPPVVITFQAAPDGSEFTGVPNKVEFVAGP